MLYIAQGILIPILFAIIFSTLLQPVVSFFVRLKINRIVSIVITLCLAILAFVGLFSILFSQAIRFSDSSPDLIERFTEIFNQAASWASGYFDISQHSMDAWINKTKEGFLTSDSTEIGHTLASVGSKAVVLILVPVYIFMILFYQPILLDFLRTVFGTRHRDKVSQIIAKIKSLIQSYLVGLLLQIAIVATMFSVGLLILGIEYAIILGIMGAFLNLIPYIGVLIAASLPMTIAIVSKTSPWFAVLVFALYFFIHLIDNNYIVPKLVASKVKINALVTIIGVVSFGALWGIPGMILCIPLTGIVKLIFDHIEPLKPWGLLLGDTMPPIIKIKSMLRRKILDPNEPELNRA
ncbi:MAG: AI-2E family transporter [Bacteroidales bacterium]|nr:AI-2E family transporter [Bacteroidales bacterium]MCF8455701.1 AI-2E family transporter [Bacteroidales bacterium]